MTSSLLHIDKEKLPRHVAIIMDGNGRWAKKHSKPRVWGHQNGVKAVRAVTEACAEIGVEYLTLYAFSKENWKRPEIEVNTLMRLFVNTVSNELKTLHKNNIRLQAIGDLDSLPSETKKALENAIESTKENSHMTLVLALSYSARWEILESSKKMAIEVRDGNLNVDDIDEEVFASYLSTKDIPDPELLIRTSGEHRISNFLLWQISYAELVFSDTLWPDFGKEELYKALLTYQRRERRFGMTGEQVTKS
jgi:undecaprenyl diphosphate synthase